MGRRFQHQQGIFMGKRGLHKICYHGVGKIAAHLNGNKQFVPIKFPHQFHIIDYPFGIAAFAGIIIVDFDTDGFQDIGNGYFRGDDIAGKAKGPAGHFILDIGKQLLGFQIIFRSEGGLL